MPEVPTALFPVAILQDRADGGWIAIGAAAEGGDRLDRVRAGAHGDDADVQHFWKVNRHAPWLAVGNTPDEAVRALIARQAIRPYDVVTLKHDLPDEDLVAGTAGTILDVYSPPPGYEVEFVGPDGLHVGKNPSVSLQPEQVELVWKDEALPPRPDR